MIGYGTVVIAGSIKSYPDREAITGPCCDPALEVVQLIENGQSTASLLARKGNQNFMTRLRDINSHQNGRVSL